MPYNELALGEKIRHVL